MPIHKGDGLDVGSGVQDGIVRSVEGLDRLSPPGGLRRAALA